MGDVNVWFLFIVVVVVFVVVVVVTLVERVNTVDRLWLVVVMLDWKNWKLF